jgi:putative ATP-dependent endonuclease of OLD family
MRLVTFSVQNYRSIKRAERLQLGNLTVLIGPNNEGKSNILRGLVVGMRLLSYGAFTGSSRRSAPSGPIRRRDVLDESYQWLRDYPVDLQSKIPAGRTTFDFEFQLTDREIGEFKESVGSSLNGLLPIRLTVGAVGQGEPVPNLEFQVTKRGRGAKTLTQKRLRIAKFLAERIEIRHIPSVRTAQSSGTLVDELVQRELRAAEESPEFQLAVKNIEAIQTPILERVGRTLQQMLQTFLPDVSDVQLRIDDRYSALRRNCLIVMNDGTPTELQDKGDGVQSLAAIALIHQFSLQAAGPADLVLAVEEPEAHLHPRAIHQLQSVLEDIATRQQVVVTTHSPLLVNRASVATNIIVDRNHARPASTIHEIREVLGVKVSDSLTAAEVVLLVEGESDAIALEAILKHMSIACRTALDSQFLMVMSMRGSTNLTYHASLLRGLLCTYHAFVDYDASGKSAVARASGERLLQPSDVTYATSPGLKESELEDLFDQRLYVDRLNLDYNVNLGAGRRYRASSKWSVRMKAEFLRAGQSWDDPREKQVKMAIAELVAHTPGDAIHSEKERVIIALTEALERKLSAARRVF